MAGLSARESTAVLRLVTGDAVESAMTLLDRVKGSPDARRAALLESVPPLIDYYAAGSATLAADYYADARGAAQVRKAYTPELVIPDRTVKIRRAVAWASAPMFLDMVAESEVVSRLAGIVQYETANPYRDTILGNRAKDPAAVGWRRVTSQGACKMCVMLADRGAVYRERTVQFATHENCHCGAEMVFAGGEVGETASPMQYTASRRSRTPKQQAALRDYLNNFYPDLHG